VADERLRRHENSCGRTLLRTLVTMRQGSDASRPAQQPFSSNPGRIRFPRPDDRDQPPRNFPERTQIRGPV
jgi:hypothetical protein